jgi:hypothetical protein
LAQRKVRITRNGMQLKLPLHCARRGYIFADYPLTTGQLGMSENRSDVWKHMKYITKLKN